MWRYRARCAGKPTYWFETLMEGDPLAAGLDLEERFGANELFIEKAQSICNACPVRQECVDSAKDVDLYYTIRGGLRPRNKINRKTTKGKCLNGHVKSGSYCDACAVSGRKKVEINANS